MFTMTPRARAVVRRVTAHPRIASSSGLRIGSQGAGAEALSVGAAAGPEQGDKIVERDGARVFLDRQAVPRVRGRLLDAVTRDDGRVHFVVRRGK